MKANGWLITLLLWVAPFLFFFPSTHAEKNRAMEKNAPKGSSRIQKTPGIKKVQVRFTLQGNAGDHPTLTIRSSENLLSQGGGERNGKQQPVLTVKFKNKIATIKLTKGMYSACFVPERCFSLDVDKSLGRKNVTVNYEQLVKKTVRVESKDSSGAVVSTAQKSTMLEQVRFRIDSASLFDKNTLVNYLTERNVVCQWVNTISGAQLGTFSVATCFGEDGIVLNNVAGSVVLLLVEQGLELDAQNFEVSSLPTGPDGARLFNPLLRATVRIELEDNEENASAPTGEVSFDDGIHWKQVFFPHTERIPVGNPTIHVRIGGQVRIKKQLTLSPLDSQRLVLPRHINAETIFITTARRLPILAVAASFGSGLPCLVDVRSMLSVSSVKILLDLCSSIRDTTVRPGLELPLWWNKPTGYILHGLSAHLKMGAGGGLGNRLNFDGTTGLAYSIQSGQVALRIDASLLLYMDRITANDPAKQSSNPWQSGIAAKLNAMLEIKAGKNVNFIFGAGLTAPQRKMYSADYGVPRAMPFSASSPLSGVTFFAGVVFTGLPFSKD